MGKNPAEELYNIDNDPDCLNNLADEPNYTKVKKELWRELKETLESQSDPRIFGKGDVFDTYEYVGNMSHSWQAYVEGNWKSQSY